MKFKHTMLQRSMYNRGKKLQYLNDMGAGSLISYYSRLINKYAPEEVSSSWVENFIFLAPLRNHSEFINYYHKFLTWSAEARKLIVENKDSLMFDWDLKDLLDLLRKVNSESMFREAGLKTEYELRKNALYGTLPHPQPIGLKVTDEIPQVS